MDENEIDNSKAGVVPGVNSSQPRIVLRGPEDPSNSGDALDDELTLSTYFAYGSPERIKALNEKIESQERALFDFETAIIMLTGNPGQADHVLTPQATAWSFNATCPCTKCELVRCRRSAESIRYAVKRLRALNSKMLNG